MTDELDALGAALKYIPAPGPDAKAAALRLAAESFDTLQGSAAALRPNQDRPQRAAILMGVMNMLKSLNSRPLLAATTSAAALCLGLVVILPLTNRGPITGTAVVLDDEKAGTNAVADAPGADQLLPPLAGKPDAPRAKDSARADSPLPTGRLASVPATSSDPTGHAGTAQPVDTAEAPMILAEPAPATVQTETAPDAAPEAAPEATMKMAAELADGLARSAPESDMQSQAASGYAEQEAYAEPAANTETFASAPENPIKVTAEEPVSTFSIDVDTASYAVVRSSLSAGYLPDPASVRVEEMVNYFPYAYAAPDDGQPFQSTVSVMQTPWNPGTRLVHIGIQGEMPAMTDRPALNLVFLIDTSGSMDEPNKLPLLKQSLELMLSQLRPDDQVAIVAYAGSAGLVLAPTLASDQARIVASLDNLAAGGSTAGAEGLALAYQIAETMQTNGEVSRILLATDGDFNVGIDDPEALKAFIAKKRETGTYLSVLGFGRGNLDDATMQALAQNGNGQAAYIDTLNEARKVLVDQLTGALYPIANNVKIQIEWNPAAVAEYRLIGYETRALNREDFNNDKVDAGDIGAGTSVTAIYEVTAPGSPALRNTPLRYGTTAEFEGEVAELGFLRLRHVPVGGGASILQETPIHATTGEPSQDARFAVAIAGFGQLLTGADYLGDWGWDQAIELALGARGSDDFGYRIEAVNLMRLAKALSD